MSFQANAFQNDAFQQGAGAGQNLAPPLYLNDNTFYSASVTRGAVDLAPARLDNTNTFFTAELGLILLAARFDNTNQFYGPQLNQELLQNARFNNSAAFYSPTVAPGAVELLPGLFTNTSEYYSPTVSNGTAVQALVCDDYVTTGYVDPGYVTFPASFSNNQFFTAALSYDQALLAARYDNSNTFFVPRVGNQYPSPWQVLSGVIYGPNGEFTGTLTAGRPVYVFDD